MIEKLTPEEAREFMSLNFFDIVSIFIFIIILIALFSHPSSKPGGNNYSPDIFESEEEYEEFVDNYNNFYDDYYDGYSPYDTVRNIDN